MTAHLGMAGDLYVSCSAGGVEWSHADERGCGTLTPYAARALARLLELAADEHERMVARAIASPVARDAHAEAQIRDQVAKASAAVAEAASAAASGALAAMFAIGGARG